MAEETDPTVGTGAAESLRARTRRAVQAEVSAAAFDLFDRQGFDGTTIEQIVAVTGLSRSSFFRYFRTKEDLVVGGLEEHGTAIRDQLVALPATESAWQTLHAALDAVLAGRDVDGRALRRSRLLATTPSLRARQMEKQEAWASLLVPEIARRMDLPPDDPSQPAPAALVAAALACLGTASQAWRQCDGAVPLSRLLARAMGGLQVASPE
jgi:AcrR family transcriptional regulator